MLQRNWRCACGFMAAVPVRMLGEVATCPKCRAQTAITMTNTHPIVAHASERVAAPASVENCARCGRKLRGDWDRHARGDAVVCDICARQAANGPVAESQAPKPGREAAITLAAAGETISAEDLHDMHDELRGRALVDDAPRRWRGHVKLLGSIALTTALVAGAITYLLQVTPESVDAYQADGMNGLALVMAGQFFWGLTVTFASLYSVCWYLERLPNDAVWANVLAIGMVSAWLGVVAMLGVNGYLMGMSMVISILIIRYLYDFSMGEFLLYCVVSSLLNSVLLVVTGLIEHAAKA